MSPGVAVELRRGIEPAMGGNGHRRASVAYTRRRSGTIRPSCARRRDRLCSHRWAATTEPGPSSVEAPRPAAAMRHALGELIKVLMERFLGKQIVVYIAVVGCAILAVGWIVGLARRRRGK
jgi:hypothetical protein